MTQFVWTAGDWHRGMVRADQIGTRASRSVLIQHGLYADHCGGWDVHAWPCPTAAAILDYLFGVTS